MKLGLTVLILLNKTDCSLLIIALLANLRANYIPVLGLESAITYKLKLHVKKMRI